MKRMSRFGAAVTMAVMLASGLAASTARLEAKGSGHGGGTTAVACVRLSRGFVGVELDQPERAARRLPQQHRVAQATCCDGADLGAQIQTLVDFLGQLAA